MKAKLLALMERAKEEVTELRGKLQEKHLELIARRVHADTRGKILGAILNNNAYQLFPPDLDGQAGATPQVIMQRQKYFVRLACELSDMLLEQPCDP